MASKPIHINTGDVFGRLTVLHEAPKGPSGHYRSLCKCSCGKEVIVTNAKLASGHTKSCGCLVFDNKNNFQHGESYTRLHMVWSSMKGRCSNPKDPAYKYYGARGIKVCQEWSDSYKKFASWARNHGYSDGLTIDRIDVNGNYEPKNCRFISLAEQARNRRSNHLITYNGKTMCIEEWAHELGINSGTLNSRLNRQHWSIKHAFEEPTSNVGRHGKQRPYDIYGTHPMVELMFDGCKTYPELAEKMARYIEDLCR